MNESKGKNNDDDDDLKSVFLLLKMRINWLTNAAHAEQKTHGPMSVWNMSVSIEAAIFTRFAFENRRSWAHQRWYAYYLQH